MLACVANQARRFFRAARADEVIFPLAQALFKNSAPVLERNSFSTEHELLRVQLRTSKLLRRRRLPMKAPHDLAVVFFLWCVQAKTREPQPQALLLKSFAIVPEGLDERHPAAGDHKIPTFMTPLEATSIGNPIWTETY